jgi:hypothetical protein
MKITNQKLQNPEATGKMKIEPTKKIHMSQIGVGNLAPLKFSHLYLVAPHCSTKINQTLIGGANVAAKINCSKSEPHREIRHSPRTRHSVTARHAARKTR